MIEKNGTMLPKPSSSFEGTDMGVEVENSVKVNWLLVLGTATGGIALVAAPYVLDWWFGGFGDWRPVTSSTLTNVGTALLLAAGLFFIERGFTRRIRNVVTVSATEAVQSEVQQVRQEAHDIEERVNLKLENIQERFEHLKEEAAAETESTFTALAKDVSFQTVTQALEEANDIRALLGGRLTVPAGRTPKPPHVTFWWGELQGYQVRDLEVDYAIELQYEAGYYSNRGGGQIARILWGPTQTPAEALLALQDEMVRAGFGAEAQDLDGSKMFSTLLATLRDAVAAKRAKPEAWFKGEACDLVTDDVIITGDGLEIRGRGVVVKSEDFPHRPGSPAYQPKKAWPPTCPHGVDSDVWATALGRGRGPHPRQGGIPRFATHAAYTKATSPHKV